MHIVQFKYFCIKVTQLEYQRNEITEKYFKRKGMIIFRKKTYTIKFIHKIASVSKTCHDLYHIKKHPKFSKCTPKLK